MKGPGPSRRTAGVPGEANWSAPTGQKVGAHSLIPGAEPAGWANEQLLRTTRGAGGSVRSASNS